MAEGLILPRGQTRLEDIGKEYFIDLASRSFFQFSSSTPTVEGKCNEIFVMHDLIHDLAHLVSANTCLHVENNFSGYEVKHHRHLSLRLSVGSAELNFPEWLKNLRTMILVSKDRSRMDQVLSKLVAKLKYVRVLHLSNLEVLAFRVRIDHLKHLRSLNLSYTQISELPSSITYLIGLQTLILLGCTNLHKLPGRMKDLTNLRHLYFDVMKNLASMPPDMGNLTKLQTLYGFILGDGRGRSISELKNMQLLRGSFCISNLDKVSSATEAKEASLDEKSYIDKLTFEWQTIHTEGDQQMEILEYLKPHKNVKDLIILRYSGSNFPSWLIDPLYKFESLQLSICPNCNSLPPLGFFRFLKFLHIGSMKKLASIGREFYGNGNDTAFPALETLVLENMKILKEWKDFYGSDMPKLHELAIIACPELISLPRLDGLNVLQKLTIFICPKVKSLPEGGLPDSLETLIIVQCPEISRRCEIGGEDWEKIQNVGRIEIDHARLDTTRI